MTYNVKTSNPSFLTKIIDKWDSYFLWDNLEFWVLIRGKKRWCGMRLTILGPLWKRSTNTRIEPMMEAYFLQDSAYITALAFRIRSILKEGFVPCWLINQPGFLDGSAFGGLNLTARRITPFPSLLASLVIHILDGHRYSFIPK